MRASQSPCRLLHYRSSKPAVLFRRPWYLCQRSCFRAACCLAPLQHCAGRKCDAQCKCADTPLADWRLVWPGCDCPQQLACGILGWRQDDAGMLSIASANMIARFQGSIVWPGYPAQPTGWPLACLGLCWSALNCTAQLGGMQQ